MPEKTICPTCGAPLEVEEGQSVVLCNFCGAEFQVHPGEGGSELHIHSQPEPQKEALQPKSSAVIDDVTKDAAQEVVDQSEPGDTAPLTGVTVYAMPTPEALTPPEIPAVDAQPAPDDSALTSETVFATSGDVPPAQAEDPGDNLFGAPVNVPPPPFAAETAESNLSPYAADTIFASQTDETPEPEPTLSESEPVTPEPEPTLPESEPVVTPEPEPTMPEPPLFSGSQEPFTSPPPEEPTFSAPPPPYNNPPPPPTGGRGPTGGSNRNLWIIIAVVVFVLICIACLCVVGVILLGNFSYNTGFQLQQSLMALL